MKIIPPPTEEDRYLWKQSMARRLTVANGGRWRVDLYPGRYGWVVRATRVPHRRKRRIAERRKPGSPSPAL